MPTPSRPRPCSPSRRARRLRPAAGLGQGLIEARERAFYVAKAAGADEIVGVVVPAPRWLTTSRSSPRSPTRTARSSPGCGHVGDGNVHLSVYLPDEARRTAFLDELFGAGVAIGGQVSGEHGIGVDKLRPTSRSPTPLCSSSSGAQGGLRPTGLLNPGELLDDGRAR